MQELRRYCLSTNVHVRQSLSLDYMLLKVSTEVMHSVTSFAANKGFLTAMLRIRYLITYSKFRQILISLPTSIHTSRSRCLSTTEWECVPELLIGQQDYNVSDCDATKQKLDIFRKMNHESNIPYSNYLVDSSWLWDRWPAESCTCDSAWRVW